MTKPCLKVLDRFRNDGSSLILLRHNVHGTSKHGSTVGSPWPGWTVGRVVAVARRPSDFPSDPAVVVLNPDDDVTAGSFAAWLDRRQVGEPLDPGVRASETLADARAAGEV